MRPVSPVPQVHFHGIHAQKALIVSGSAAAGSALWRQTGKRRDDLREKEKSSCVGDCLLRCVML
jgi:hypothetical protein